MQKQFNAWTQSYLVTQPMCLSTPRMHREQKKKFNIWLAFPNLSLTCFFPSLPVPTH